MYCSVDTFSRTSNCQVDGWQVNCEHGIAAGKISTPQVYLQWAGA